MSWTRCALLTGLFIVLGCATASNQEDEKDKWAHHMQGLNWTIGYDDGLAKSRAAGKPAFVFATASWCGYCKKLAAESFTDEAVKQLLDRFELVLVDIDTEIYVAKELDVQGVPNIIMKSEDGKTFARIDGYLETEEFLRQLDSALAVYEEL
jgi:thioredoxin-related protein